MLTNLLSSVPSIILLYCFFIVFLFSLGSDYSSKLISSVIAFTIFIIIFGLRTLESGTDTNEYYSFFHNFVYNYKVNINDPVFIFLTKIIGLVTVDPKYFIFFITLIQLSVIVFSLFYYGARNIGVYLLIFVFFMPGFDLLSNTIRQGLGLSFFTFSLFLYLRGQILYSLGFLIIASLIHLSFLSGVVIYFLHFIKINKYIFVSVYISSIIVFLCQGLFDFSISDFLYSLNLPGVLGYLVFKLYVYENYADGRLSGMYKYYFFLIFFIPIFLLLILDRIEFLFNDRKHYNVFFFYSLILFCYSIISSGTFSFRILYIIYPMTVLVYYFLYERSKGYQKLIVFLLFFMSGLLVLDANQMLFFDFSL